VFSRFKSRGEPHDRSSRFGGRMVIEPRRLANTTVKELSAMRYVKLLGAS